MSITLHKNLKIDLCIREKYQNRTENIADMLYDTRIFSVYI